MLDPGVTAPSAGPSFCFQNQDVAGRGIKEQSDHVNLQPVSEQNKTCCGGKKKETSHASTLGFL